MADGGAPSLPSEQLDVSEIERNLDREIPGSDEVLPPPAGWTPNEDFIAVMMAMGITRNAAIKGLYYTGNFSADAATGWVFDNSDLPDLDEELPAIRACRLDDQEEYSSYKMVFVVNKELSMGLGKVAAQVAHAAVTLYRAMLENGESNRHLVSAWENEGQTKVVLGGDNAAQLFDMETFAKQEGLSCCVITDAGRTQVAPGSVTCFAVVGRNSDVDKITGTLRLL